jgi:hypothetical protein
MFGVFVKPLLAAVGVKIIEPSLVFAGSACLLGRSRRHWQAAYRVLRGFGHDRRLGTAGPALGFRLQVTLRILVKLLIAAKAAKIISFSFINAG